MKKLIILFAAGLISGCVTGHHPSHYFNEVQVVNLAGESIQDISLRVLASPKVLNCAAVAKFAMCYDHFGRWRYPQQGLELSWTHPDGSRKTDTLNPRIPAYYSSTFPLRIVMEVQEDGSVNAFYEQEEPGGGGIFIKG